MSVTIQDGRLLSAVDPTNVSHYLRAGGWRRVASDEGRYSLWATIDSSGGIEALLPLNQRFADYALRIAELLETLSQFEKRSQLEILDDIHNVANDVFRFRTDPPVSQPGTIPLEEGVRLVSCARDMLVAAANAEHEPRPYYTRLSNEVEDVLRRVLFGQTKRSSYVVTALIPVPPSLQLPLDESLVPLGLEPFERRVGIRLLSSLEALADAAFESAAKSSVEPIREAVQYGVSLNLCRAVASAQPGAGSLEVSGRWASVRSTPSHGPGRTDRALPTLVEFHEPILRQVQEIVAVLSAGLPREGTRVYGHVELLEQPVQEELFGEIRISGFAEDQQRKVRVRLPRDLYLQAIAAHQGKRLVSVVGTLVRRGTRYHLEEPRDFFVVSESTDADELERTSEE